ncbi:T9SS type A sorting domain-containing protein [Luteirhabdus pelagi]|uniref:T9SS type A sorting domain-containing protein n=1 Tax=Luteirhabdus pelagi TaxID=2792783 RepID=UPI00193A3ECD|nr:T9SS type A sorting domain-containing protein [Luteirhabdus pelagi]
MKLLPYLALMLIGKTVYAQDYTPLLNNYNEWQVTTCFSGCITDAYYTDGDTIVDGQHYKILDGYHYISRGFLLREEIENRKIYLTTITPQGVDDYLLYDFSLEVGDSIDIVNPITPFPRDGGYYVLDSIIPRPLVDGNDYRYFYLSPAESNTETDEDPVWIEGVGSLSLINAAGGTPDINEVGALSCFFKDGELFYSNLDSISECTPTFLENRTFHSLHSVGLQNPIQNGEIVLFNTEKVKEVLLYDIRGNELIHAKNEGRNTISISAETISSGIYFVKLKGIRNSERTLKLIKM